MISLFFSLLFLIYPIKPDMSLKFKDISIFQSLNAMRLVGVKTDFIPVIPKEGRIGSIVIEIRGNLVTINANKFYIKGDPIVYLKAFYNRKTEYWYLKTEALGGIIEIEGIMPKN
jgi:hypothetical protein